MSNKHKVLSVENLEVAFNNRDKVTHAVKSVSFDLFQNESIGVVGESGSGKSVTCFSILKLLDNVASSNTKGAIHLHENGETLNLLSLSNKRLCEIRGKKIAMIFQEPMSSLNPVRRCGDQACEILGIHQIAKSNERKAIILDLFKKVSLTDVERIYQAYPHQLSGGQLQRVNIAMALAGKPDILICDEPTTALDVTVQKDIIALLRSIVKEYNLALIFVCHDLDLVAALCDRALVMYQGEIVDSGALPELFLSPNHLYTKALLSCKPSFESKKYALPTVSEVMKGNTTLKNRISRSFRSQKAIIEVKNISVRFKQSGGLFAKAKYLDAVKALSLSLYENEILGIVGESGSGKSTVAMCIAGLIEPSTGSIKFKEKTVSKQELQQNKSMRTKIQLIFQDPYSSLNPQMTVGKAVEEPIRYHKIINPKDVTWRVSELFKEVGLDDSFIDRYPHQLSGGQRQRVCIARSLALNPEVLICDESVSALDVSVQAQILNLLDQLRTTQNLSIIFISHDLSVVHYLCDRIMVMNKGEKVEEGESDEIIHEPKTAYTKLLIGSIPKKIQKK